MIRRKPACRVYSYGVYSTKLHRALYNGEILTKSEGITIKTPRATTTDADVGQRIRMMRNTCGLSQQELAEALGISYQQVHKYEQGANRVGAGRLYDIAQVFGVAPSAFFATRLSAGNANADLIKLGNFVSSQEGAELNIAFTRIASLKLRKQILSLVSLLAAGTQ